MEARGPLGSQIGPRGLLLFTASWAFLGLQGGQTREGDNAIPVVFGSFFFWGEPQKPEKLYSRQYKVYRWIEIY